MLERSQIHRPKNARPAVTTAMHKFAPGAQVVLDGKEDGALFEITRLLPEGGSGLQYRIKNAQEGHERVAAERRLTAVRG